MKYEFIAVDIQNDFASEGGLFYTSKPSVKFLKETLFPFLKEKGMKINNIISDYRAFRPGYKKEACVPGTWGYETLVPKELTKITRIKSMNSPLWVRENIGEARKKAGPPYQDPKGFNDWLDKNVGNPEEVIPILIGLTIDCCVLSTAQEVSWRGYKSLILKEGVDHATGKIEDRDKVLDSTAFNWGKAVSWEELKTKLQ